jgi:hypothetical protein
MRRSVVYVPFCLDELMREDSSPPFERAHNGIGDCKSTTERRNLGDVMDDNGYYDRLQQ